MQYLLSVFMILCGVTGWAQSARDASVELHTEVDSNPARITLHWIPNAGATQHVVYRKLKSASNWGPVMATLPGSATEYTDTTVSKGVSYEYRILRTAVNFSGNGYINTGIEVPPIEHRGILLLVVDDAFVEDLAPEITRLHGDLEGDGWQVRQIHVSRNASPAEVRMQIVSAYQMDPLNTRSVFLLGHVPVPYSGNFNLDGHPDHTGAWPADVYYGDINGVWTDVSVNNANANDPRNRNLPGDGKFDQSLIPSDIELHVGRVDFANMPAFAASELELLRSYLNKSHAYRHSMWTAEPRTLIDDNFGYFSGEAFAASGWNAAGPLTGYAVAGDYFTSMASESYLWSYGCGGGTYTSAGGIGSTATFAASDLQTVFTMLFGSYFGDWDSQNNFLRAPLAQGKTLTNAWSGRPHWVFHHMGMGEPIGYSTRISQNNNGLYFSGIGARYVSIALMGDPALRNHVVAPPQEVTAQLSNGMHVQLSWQAPDDDVLGYYVYRKDAGTDQFIRMHDAPVAVQEFTDSCLINPGMYVYMVRAMKLQESPSGTYYNLSQGIMSTVLQSEDFNVSAGGAYEVHGDTVIFMNTSSNATVYQWYFGDGSTSDETSPVHVFDNGQYVVTLIASNHCNSDTIEFLITIDTGTRAQDVYEALPYTIFPNPASGIVSIRTTHQAPSDLHVRIYHVSGMLMHKERLLGDHEVMDVSLLCPGMYTVVILDAIGLYAQKLIVQH